MELVKKPCLKSDVTATQHLTSPLKQEIDACDGDTDTFYHSIENTDERNPFLAVSLGENFLIKKITVVNVHTGNFCTDNPGDCTERINGAKVEVLKGLELYIYK